MGWHHATGAEAHPMCQMNLGLWRELSHPGRLRLREQQPETQPLTAVHERLGWMVPTPTPPPLPFPLPFPSHRLPTPAEAGWRVPRVMGTFADLRRCFRVTI